MKFVLSSMSKAIIAVSMCLSITACNFDSAPKNEVKVGGKTMGTFYNITVNGDYPGGIDKLQHDAEAVLGKINKDISTFDQNSILSKFNRFNSTERFPINKDIADVVIESLIVGEELQGATDITVGPLVNVWGFGPKKREGEPSKEEIAKAKANIGLDKIHVEFGTKEVTIRKDNPNIYIDLATVGEGYGADKLAELMDSRGIKNYMVSVAGAIRTRGVNSRGTDWVIALEDPTNGYDVAKRIEIPVCTRGQAISTSGSYRNYFEDKNGVRRSHIIDPITGEPITHNTVSISVIGKTALWTDAVDTGLMVWGYEKALTYANEHNIPIYAIEKTKDGYKAHYSRAMQQYLECD